MKTVTPQCVAEMMERGEVVELIDVRTPIEFAVVHARGARLVPLDALDPKQIQSERQTNADAPIYVICKSVGRSTKACAKLEQAGLGNIVNVEGGTDAWVAAGLPVLRTERISLERQVRLVAGLLVLIGAVLGWLVHPGFYGLCAFVGAGLTFSGLTNFCGMGMLLAKMPWNSVQNCK